MMLTKRSTKDPKLISNHFIIINNIYSTGEKLFTCKIRQSDKCHICNETDILIHTIATNHETQNFISQVMEDLDAKKNKYIEHLCI